MPRLSDAERKMLRGRKCEECKHALAAHNDLGYCQRESKTKGECVCPTKFRAGAPGSPDSAAGGQS